jgi:hypothetical protein
MCLHAACWPWNDRLSLEDITSSVHNILIDERREDGADSGLADLATIAACAWQGIFSNESTFVMSVRTRAKRVRDENAKCSAQVVGERSTKLRVLASRCP